MRSVWLAVLNDGTDETENMHSLEVKLQPHRDAYSSLVDAMRAAYEDDHYPVDDDETNGYKLLPKTWEVKRSNEGRYVAPRNVLDCDGEPFYKKHEIIEDPMGRTFMVFFIDPEIGQTICPNCVGAKGRTCKLCAGKGFVDINSVLSTMARIPGIEGRFLPMSDVVLILDALRFVPHLATDPPPCQHINRQVFDGQQSIEHFVCLDCHKRWSD